MKLISHKEIIDGAGGWGAVRDLLCLGRSETIPKVWAFRDSIPATYWQELTGLGVATLEELAAWPHRALSEEKSGAPVSSPSSA